MNNHGGPFSLVHLSDEALLSGIAELTRSQQLLTARLVAHLAEDLATVIEAALDLLIADRKQKKFGETSRAQKKRRPAKESRVTNATRREVVARDGLRCSYVDANGRRCEERGFLELDHREVRAKGGSSDQENVRVLCRAHNQGEAERVFGKDHMERCRKRSKLTVRDSARSSYTTGVQFSAPAMSRANSSVTDFAVAPLMSRSSGGSIRAM